MALVTGILATSDPKQIEAALASQNIDASKVRVVTKAAKSVEHDESALDFIFVAESQDSNDISDDFTKGTGVMSDSGGTSVPGINRTGPTLSAIANSPGDSSPNYLSDVAIPLDQKDNYNDAIDAGRSVLLYNGEDAPTVATAFKAAGLRNVHTY